MLPPSPKSYVRCSSTHPSQPSPRGCSTGDTVWPHPGRLCPAKKNVAQQSFFCLRQPLFQGGVTANSLRLRSARVHPGRAAVHGAVCPFGQAAEITTLPLLCQILHACIGWNKGGFSLCLLSIFLHLQKNIYYVILECQEKSPLSQTVRGALIRVCMAPFLNVHRHNCCKGLSSPHSGHFAAFPALCCVTAKAIDNLRKSDSFCHLASNMPFDRDFQ